jgi:UDP-N-acetylmuramoyl-tripeptide--D-alanyl-D-alanine ligase
MTALASWTVGRLLDATRGELVAGEPAWPIDGIGLDSRRIAPGQAFVAVRGLNFDAHEFVPEALRNGARCVIVSDVAERPDGAAVIRVEDTIRALGRIAAAHRRRRAVPVVAITGSCGKSTTKELAASLLQTRFRTVKTHLTENNHIGVPLTLLRLSPEDELAVLELGSNHPGEIAALADIAHPDVAVITNVGPAHLEYFGSLRGVLEEKLSLIEALRPGGTAIVPGDQIEVVLEAKRRLPQGRRLLTFGVSEQCGIAGLDIRREPEGWSFRVRGVTGAFTLGLPGSHNVENALAALAVADALGVPLKALREPLAACRALPMRSEVIRAGDLTLIADCYNANPLSFARAIDSLTELPAARRILIAGDMRELGDHAIAAHQAIGQLAAERGVDLILAVGEFASEVVHGATQVRLGAARAFASVDALLEALLPILQAGDGLLIKGSRGMRLERVVESLVHQDAMAAQG